MGAYQLTAVGHVARIPVGSETGTKSYLSKMPFPKRLRGPISQSLTDAKL